MGPSPWGCVSIVDYWDPIQALFLNDSIGGLIGPFGLLIIGFTLLTNRKYKPLGGLWIIVEFIVIAQYFTLVDTTPFYWWNILILILGVIISTFQLIGK